MDDAAVDWLLNSAEPAVQVRTRRDILGEAVSDSDDVFEGQKVSALLSGQRADGGFGPGSPYRKWTGAHWRLVALVDFGVPATEPRVAAAAEHELAWIARQQPYRSNPSDFGQLPRICASIGGNALAVTSRLGLAADPRAQTVARTLLATQWPDGGWNCDVRANGRRSSFHETLATAWGLFEYADATGDAAARQAAERAVELFLLHRLLYSLGTGTPGRGRAHRRPAGQVINPEWLQLRYPSYWHYDILRALTILTRMGKVTDPRAADALDELERHRQPDGRWVANGRWWKQVGGTVTPEVVDWGRPGRPNELITLHAVHILRAAGRLGAFSAQ